MRFTFRHYLQTRGTDFVLKAKNSARRQGDLKTYKLMKRVESAYKKEYDDFLNRFVLLEN